MGDLISRSEVVKAINAIDLDNPGDDKEDILEKAISCVDHFPTAYDVDAVMAELKELRASFDCKKCKYFERGIGTCDKDCTDALIDDLIDIVRNAGKDGSE